MQNEKNNRKLLCQKSNLDHIFCCPVVELLPWCTRANPVVQITITVTVFTTGCRDVAMIHQPSAGKGTRTRLTILLCFFLFRLRGSHPLWPVFPEPFRYSQKS